MATEILDWSRLSCLGTVIVFFISVVHQLFEFTPGHPDFTTVVFKIWAIGLFCISKLKCIVNAFEDKNLTNESAVLGYLTLLSQDKRNTPILNCLFINFDHVVFD